MKIKSAAFVTSARGLEDCPAWDLPEFAFIGRSNVGKSSMINLLSNKDALAKVSATPGKTRLLNFFLMNEMWSLVDLPGYGFAKAAKSEKVDFNERAGDYLEQRENLRRVFVLIDSRHSPQRIDLEFTKWLGSTGLPFSLVFTKVDKQSAAKTKANIALFLETLTPHLNTVPDVLTSSVKTRDGRDQILRTIRHSLGI
ncbi:MAG: YihA family ribosome biogenesis GTP-binding protein [Gloeobacteraceae cyanobacterium ES-bin-144]|nr:YihA family ribosome biogenesis GTP-binding protein [Verrucomicrobiales bacterium]